MYSSTSNNNNSKCRHPASILSVCVCVCVKVDGPEETSQSEVHCKFQSVGIQVEEESR